MVFQEGASICQPSCGDPEAKLCGDLPARSMCVCKEGYVLDDAKCVPQANCGCKDTRGIYYKVTKYLVL